MDNTYNDTLAQLHSRFSIVTIEPLPFLQKNRTKCNGTDDLGSEDDDGDIIPMCYVLDINNDAIGIKSIWVHQTRMMV